MTQARHALKNGGWGMSGPPVRIPRMHCHRGHEIAIRGTTPQNHCRVCHAENAKRLRQNSAATRRREAYTKVRVNFGLSAEAYDRLVLTSEGRCDVCGSESPSGRGLTVDHDHATGEVRGMLCSLCNVALGHVREDLAILEGLAAYLRRHA